MSGPATAARAAARSGRPSATSRPAAISTRVDATSRSPAVSRRRIAWPSCTSCAADVVVDARLVRDDLLLDVGRREVELDGDHALAGRVLEVLEHALVAGVVRHDEAEPRRRVEDDAEPVDRELAAVVGERVDHDGGVLARLDDLVEVADRALADGPGQRTVDPASSRRPGAGSGRRGRRW